jgi:N utilization substance protein B
MLNRRQLRIKVIQAAYAFLQGETDNLDVAEKNLFYSLEKVQDLLVYQFLLLEEILKFAKREREESKNKYFPDEIDKMTTTHFTENPVMNLIATSNNIHKLALRKKISWQNNLDFAENIFKKIKVSEFYREYILNEENNFKINKDFVEQIFIRFVINDEVLENHYEEQSIFWSDDIEFVNTTLVKLIAGLKESDVDIRIPSVFKDEDDDRLFVKSLFRKVALKHERWEEYIKKYTNNWEIERIALMDMLLMKTALTELTEFETIPVKVTMNEYIEISKMFSTPKSSQFINGILDKILNQLISENKIKKSGRGLME